MPTIDQDSTKAKRLAKQYAGSEGFDLPQYQALHEAEGKYYQEIQVDCSNDPNYSPTTQGRNIPTCYTTKHNNNAYIPLNITNVEDGYNPNSWQDHWLTANAGAEGNSKVFSSSGTTDQNAVFDGGFAGKCDTGLQWQYDQQDDERWECSGELPWQHKYYVPDVESGETEVGVFIDSQTFNTGEGIRSLESVWFRQNSENLDVTHVDVLCYDGESYSRDMDENRWFNKRVSVPDTVSEPFLGVTGEIEVSDSVYTCEWQFEAVTGSGEERTFNDDGRTPEKIPENTLTDKSGVTGTGIEELKSGSISGSISGNSNLIG